MGQTSERLRQLLLRHQLIQGHEVGDLHSIGWFRSPSHSYELVNTPTQCFLIKTYLELHDDHLPEFEAEATRWLLRRAPLPVLPIACVDGSARCVIFGPIAAEPLSWKGLLCADVLNPILAIRLGEALATVHLAVTDPSQLPAVLGDRMRFRERRLHSDFEVTARAHPDLATTIEAIVKETWNIHHSLVLGSRASDMLLMAEQKPRWTTMELAHFGDPAIDVSTLVSGLLAVGCADPSRARFYVNAAEALWSGYQSVAGAGFGHSGMPQGGLEARVCRQVGVLLLAAVDGAEPSLSEANPQIQRQVREAGRVLVGRPLGRLDGVFTRVLHVADRAVALRESSSVG